MLLRLKIRSKLLPRTAEKLRKRILGSSLHCETFHTVHLHYEMFAIFNGRVTSWYFAKDNED